MHDFHWSFLLVMLVGIVIVIILPGDRHFDGSRFLWKKKKRNKKKKK